MNREFMEKQAMHLLSRIVITRNIYNWLFVVWFYKFDKIIYIILNNIIYKILCTTSIIQMSVLFITYIFISSKVSYYFPLFTSAFKYANIINQVQYLNRGVCTEN